MWISTRDFGHIHFFCWFHPQRCHHFYGGVIHYSQNLFSLSNKFMQILVTFWVCGGGQILAQSCSEKDELWKHTGPWSPELLQTIKTQTINEEFHNICASITKKKDYGLNCSQNYLPISHLPVYKWFPYASLTMTLTGRHKNFDAIGKKLCSSLQ